MTDLCCSYAHLSNNQCSMTGQAEAYQCSKIKPSNFHTSCHITAQLFTSSSTISMVKIFPLPVMDLWGAHTTYRFMSRGTIKGTHNSAGKMCSKFNGNPSVPITPYWSVTHHHDGWQWWEWFPHAWMHERMQCCSQPLLFPVQGRSCSWLLLTRTCAPSQLKVAPLKLCIHGMV